VLITHSGLHVGGDPIYPSWQEQTPCPLSTLQVLYGPQGDGMQGFILSIGATKRK
jgi:hypothetical protein